MCIQMLKKSTKELNHFTNLQLSSMDHQVDPAEHFRKTTVSLPKLQTSQFHLISWWRSKNIKNIQTPWTPFWQMILKILIGGILQELFSLRCTFCNGQLLWRGRLQMRTSLRSVLGCCVGGTIWHWNQTTVRYHRSILYVCFFFHLQTQEFHVEQEMTWIPNSPT